MTSLIKNRASCLPILFNEFIKKIRMKKFLSNIFIMNRLI